MRKINITESLGDNINNFECTYEYELTDVPEHQQGCYAFYEHMEDFANFQIRFVPIKYPFFEYTFKDENGYYLRKCDFLFELYIEDVTKAYNTKGTFDLRDEMKDYSDIRKKFRNKYSDNAKDVWEYNTTQDREKYEQYQEQLDNGYSPLYQRYIKYTDKKHIFNSFISQISSYVVEEGYPELMAYKAYNVDMLLNRLEEIYEFEAEMMLDESWLEYCEENGIIEDYWQPE